MDLSRQLTSALEGRYEVEREIGAGGMATVYLARDLKHDRPVALKVLKPELAAVVGGERFLAEIRTTANLQHPNILPLHDSGEADSFLFYVMPFVEGESLRDRLDREHQIPVDDAVQIAKNLAEALDYAHRKGVIHRDIKPANVLLLEGKPVIADFGIALAVGTAGGGRLTETGLSLGTPHYMSPEQATGDAHIGPASDIYAVGCVLYEMLVGEPPYVGSNAQAVLGKIIVGEAVAPRKHRASVPANVDAAIRKALEKVPADRFASAQEFARALGDAGFRHGVEAGAGAAGAVGPWNRTTVIGWSVAALVTLAFAWSLLSDASVASEPAPQRTSLLLPPDRPLAFGWTPGGSLAISPNGVDVAYVGRNPDKSRNTLMVRSLASRSVRELEGTEEAVQPFFSPEGRWVGFFTPDGELKKVSLDGGSPLTLAEGLNGGRWAAGTWTDDGEIIFGGTSTGLRRVSAEGGSPEELTTVEAARERWHGNPDHVPGTRTVLFSVQEPANGSFHIEAVDLDTGERELVVENGAQPRYLPSGHLLFSREGALLVAPFDARRLALTGPAVPVADEIRTDGPDPGRDGNLLQFVVSRAGTLAYVPPAEGTTTLGIVSRTGSFEPLGPPLTNPVRVLPRVSPNGRYLSFQDGPDRAAQAYLLDIARGSIDKPTQSGLTQGMAWHPNGLELAVAAIREAGSGIFITQLGGAEELLVPPKGTANARNLSWSPDGEVLAYTLQDGSEHDIWIVTKGDPSSARALIEGPAQEWGPRFSPDGRWLAYVSDESGRLEVYARRYPEGERLRVSTEGGSSPVWSPQGSELFFHGLYAGTPRMMSASVTPLGETLRLGAPQPVLDLRVTGADGRPFLYYSGANAGAAYDVFPDGRRFLMVRTPVTPSLEIVLTQNFFEEMKRTVPK